MHANASNRSNLIYTLALGLGAVMAGNALAASPATQPATRPATLAPVGDAELLKPTTQPVIAIASAPATAPATAPVEASIPDNVKVTPEARKELEQMRDAYRKLTSLDLAGSISGHFDVAGKKDDPTKQFSAAFQAPNKFTHQRKDEVLIGATGDKAYAYLPAHAIYVQKDQPKDKPTLQDMPKPMGDMVRDENPSLALALSGDAAAQLVNAASEVKKIEDSKVGDKSYSTLAMSTEAGDFTVLLDPDTHLLRRMTVDQTKYLMSVGQPDVKAAQVTWDYATVTPNSPVKENQFAWTPPADARDAGGANNNDAMADDDNAAAQLEGHPAPDFKLPGLDGKDVALADLKGSVVVLDFWATWCGPCVMSLPHLDKIYQDMKGAGVKVFAVNVDADKSVVAPFVQEKKLTVPVLLDNSETKVSEKYGARAIPETVVIGKDGKVRKVIVGFDPNGGEETLQNAIKAAMDESK